MNTRDLNQSLPGGAYHGDLLTLLLQVLDDLQLGFWQSTRCDDRDPK